MTDELRIGLSQLLRKAMIDHDTDFLKERVRVLSQALMEMEVEEHVGAARHERSAGRVGRRNGYRERSWDTRVGTVELKVPRVRNGGYFPSLLEPRRKAERALATVVREAYVQGGLHPQGGGVGEGFGDGRHLQEPGLGAMRAAR
jgi:transposase-like protein